MMGHRRPGLHNRHAGRVGGKRIKKAISPPANAGFWIAVPGHLLNSPAWLAMSPQCRKFIDALMDEFCAHGGTENGSLKAPYDQLQARGVRRESALDAITEADALGIATASLQCARLPPV
jgi:hypothetical protein